MIMRVAGAYLALVGAGVAIHFLLDPLIYDASWEESIPPAWIALDWLMAAGLAIALPVTFRAKRAADAGSELREYLTANVRFYVACALALLFTWNAVQIDWAAGDQTPDSQVWVFIDVVLPMLFVALGIGLWNEAEA